MFHAFCGGNLKMEEWNEEEYNEETEEWDDEEWEEEI